LAAAAYLQITRIGGVMIEDEIMKGVWRARDAFAKRHRYNLDAMVEELRQLERQSPNKLVDRSGEAAKKTRRRKGQRSDR
jgi:tRNA-dihydrouridine synthase